jgi:hypothetical protein
VEPKFVWKPNREWLHRITPKGIAGVRPRVQEAKFDGALRNSMLVDLGSPGSASPTDVVASSPVGGLGKLFWIDSRSGNPAVMRADLDGTNPATLLAGGPDGLSQPYYLLLDERHKMQGGGGGDLTEARLYWLDEGAAKEIAYVKPSCYTGVSVLQSVTTILRCRQSHHALCVCVCVRACARVCEYSVCAISL